MSLIRIIEQAPNAETPGSFHAEVIFGQEEGFPCQVSNPFSESDEEALEWYFEEYLKFPYINTVRFERAAQSIREYGETLFKQVFASDGAKVEYAILKRGGEALRFEIIGSPAFHAFHWEALVDPDLPKAFALTAPMTRRSRGSKAGAFVFQEAPQIRILLVTARPGGRDDVGYRTISRPLVEALRNAKIPVQVDILRPGTYEALSKHLQNHDSGSYHVLHFDGHGGVLNYEQLQSIEIGETSHTAGPYLKERFGRPNLTAFEGYRGYLSLELPDGKGTDLLEASELAQLLQQHRIPMVILDACQSAKQIEAQETSLGSHLMEAGVALVVAMSYSVTVSAAAMMMEAFYQQLFDGKEFAQALRLARWELSQRRERKAAYNQTIQLEDWILPVIYQNRPLKINLREQTPAEAAAFFQAKADSYPEPQTRYGFHGRDLDVLEVEKKLYRHNLLLIQGLGGSGKSTLLQHLAHWWQKTGFVKEVFYFGYDQQAWTRQQLLNDLAQKLAPNYLPTFHSLSETAQQAMITEQLRGERHLLLLDNLESITGSHLAIGKPLSDQEQQRLKEFLRGLRGGKSLVVLGSRGPERWLAEGTFGEQTYILNGLDREAASGLVQSILAQCSIPIPLEDPHLSTILDRLDGFPLALEVILPNLKQRSSEEVLRGLAAGDVSLDTPETEDKTRNILLCIEYSHGNLDPEAQQLLACLAPFSSTFHTGFLGDYFEHLKKEPVTSSLAFERWPEVLQTAESWGLIGKHPQFGALGYSQLQPTLPFFLKGRLAGEEMAAMREGIERAFVFHYDEFGKGIVSMVASKEASEKLNGKTLSNVEWENFQEALEIALQRQLTFNSIFGAIDVYCGSLQAPSLALNIAQQTFQKLETYPEQILLGEFLDCSITVLDIIARNALFLQQYELANTFYKKARDRAKSASEKKSVIFDFQLGMVAQQQQDWQEAKRKYNKVAHISIEFHDLKNQAAAFHQLGTVAQSQGDTMRRI